MLYPGRFIYLSQKGRSGIVHNYLLTIAIPTYNRSLFLQRNLDHLYQQREDLKEVELIVSDNASTDDTYAVIEKYQSLGLSIKYIRNAENKGSDFNIAQCYIQAQGKYVLALGDDDLLLNGAVEQLLILLNKDDYGVVYLNSREFTNQGKLNIVDLNYSLFTDPIEFIKKVKFYVTFISGNIINKKYLDADNLAKYHGTSLIQVPFILDAILRSSNNIYVSDTLIASEPDNSGGYNLFKIFSENFNQIISELRWNKGDIDTIRNIINNSMLSGFFPQFILKLKLNKNHNFFKSNPLHHLKPLFREYANFWICCYPIYLLPNKLAVIYSYFIRAFIKFRLVKS